MVLIEHLVGAPGIDLARFGVDLRIARILPAFLLFIGVTVVLFDAAGHVTTGKELSSPR